MEGVHFVGGPWFTVHESSREWQSLDRIWISDGQRDGRATVEHRVWFAEDSDVD